MIKIKLIARFRFCLVFCLAILWVCCSNKRPAEYEIIELAQSEKLWTGIAVSDEGRIFVNYPRWSPEIYCSVAELSGPDLTPTPYPDQKWNSWRSDIETAEHFVCVQSVYIDRLNYLWVLDTGLDITRGIRKGGAKLLKIDLSTNRIIHKVYFDSTIVPAGSYLNDVRIDTDKKYAYISESGTGAIVVVNLTTGISRRLLTTHFSVKAEDIVLDIEGKKWLNADGSRPKIHVDGIALSNDGDYLYYQALTGRTMYRIRTKWLRNREITPGELDKKVQPVAKTGASDGIYFDRKGNLYLSSLEYNAIKRLTPKAGIETVVSDSLLSWPDSFSITGHGIIFVTTSQIHLMGKTTQPYRLFKIQKREN